MTNATCDLCQEWSSVEYIDYPLLSKKTFKLCWECKQPVDAFYEEIMEEMK